MISFVCTWLTSFNLSYFSYNPVSFKKDKTSSILTFSNNSVKVIVEKSLSNDNESFAFYKNVFNCASYLTRQTLWLWFLVRFYLSNSVQHVFVLIGWFLWDALFRICSKQFVVFLYSFHLAFSQCVLNASRWCIHTIV